MRKEDVKKKLFEKMDLCFKDIVEETIKDRDTGWAMYWQYRGLTAAAHILDIISFDDMMKLNDNAFETYKGLR